MLIVKLTIIQFYLKLNRPYGIGVMNQMKKIFLLGRQINVWKWVINGLTENKSWKKQKEAILKKKLLSIIYKAKKQYKKSKKDYAKTCQKNKKTRLKSTKRKIPATN